MSSHKKVSELTPEELVVRRAKRKEYMRGYYARNPDYREKSKKRVAEWVGKYPSQRASNQRDSYYRNKYGISLFDYNRMRKEQNFSCALCLKHEDKVWCKRPFGKARREGRLVVDHCHVTGVVRGLLCDQCNHLLGNVQDDPERLYRMAAYLLRFKVAI